MKRLYISLITITLFLVQALSQSGQLTPDASSDLWVLAGQSNMQGAGKLLEQAPANPDILMYNMDNSWQVALHPLHRMFESHAPVHRKLMGRDSAEWVRLRKQSREKPIGGVCSGLFFARHLHENGIGKIGLIPCAHGGTSMDQWSPEKKELGDESLYGAMINRIEANGGKVKGLLWYQGESDANNPLAYENKMLKLIDAVRKDLGQPDLPVIFVQISRFYLMNNNETHMLGWGQVKESQRRIMSLRKNVYMVSAVDLSLDDLVHISYEGQERLGRRMAEVALTKVYGRKGHASPINVESIEYNDKNRIVKVRFSGVSGKLMAPGRVADFRITSSDPDVHNFTIAYRADLDPEDPHAVLVRVQNSLTDQEYISYGLGITAYCNLVDEADMAVPAFGPLPVIKPLSLSGKTHKAVIGVEQKADYALDWWIPRHEKILERIGEGDVDMVFMGNSITKAWENAGREVWEKYYGSRKAVNMGFGGDQTQHVIWRIQNGELDGIDPKLVVNEAANLLIKDFADGESIHFLDINDRFMKKNGELGNFYSPDQVHLSEKGYLTWAKAMEPMIEMLLKKK